MMRLCTLFAILFIIKVTSSQQLEERCPSCCHHTFNETTIKTAGRPQPFWDCTEDEKLAINAARCMSECAYNLPPPQINPDYMPWPLINLRNLSRSQLGMLGQCFGRCFSPDYCSSCSDNMCMSICTEFSRLLNDTMNANKPSPPMHPAFYTSSNGGYQIRIEPRDSRFPDNTVDEGSGQPMNTQNLTYGFIIKLYTPTANKTSYCCLVDNNFGTFIRDIDHLCTPTQLSYAVVNRYGVSDYSPVNTECLGNYSVDGIGRFNDIQTCVSKDLRPGFEGHDVVGVSWETHSTHEPYCVGEYFIDVYPSQSDDECKNGEIVSAIVDKHAKLHQFLSTDPAIKLFNDSCEYDIIIHGRRVPEFLGHVELVTDETNGITLSLNQPQYLVVENDTSLIVTLTLNRIACEDAVVEVTISDGSAYAGQDYAISTSLVFNVTIFAGQTSSSFSIDIINDTIMEDDQTFHITIRSSYLHHSSSTVTIIDDDDDGTISFDRHDYEFYENDGPAKLVLRLSKPLECCSFSVQIEIIDVTAIGGLDYVFPRSGYIRVIFPAGIVSVSVPIRLIEDEIIEGTEYFNVSIVDVSLPQGVTVAGSPSASVNILDDDNGCVHFDRDSYSIRESMNSLPVTLTLTTVASYDIYVLIATAANTARDCDYNYGPYRATFKAGNQQAVFRINIFDDDIYEKSEGFEFMIANTSTHAVSVCPPNRGSVIIMDDEEKIRLSFNLSNYNVDEDTETLSPVLTLDKPSPCCITVLAELTDVSATGGGVDYGDQSQKIYKYIFPAGEISATPVEPILIINDNITESDETLKITTIKLSIPLGVQTRGDSAIITIKDDDSIEP